MENNDFKDLFVWNEGKIEDVRFWCEPQLTAQSIRNIESIFDLKTIDGFVAIEARGFYLAGIASAHFNLPVIMVRKHKSFYDKMAHEKVDFKNWKGESESLSLLTDSMPKVKSALIVDDILDTGASMRAVKDLLSRFEIQISGAFYLLNSYGEAAGRDFEVPIGSVLTRKLFA